MLNKNRQIAQNHNISDCDVSFAKKKTSSLKSSAAYPSVWLNAFALGENVRFTRTPEVELMRRPS